MAKLEIIAGPQAGLTFSLSGENREYQIGRNPTNPIVLVDMNASRNHACISSRPDGYYIQDAGSSNGTFVNGMQVAAPLRLEQNHEIKIGSTIFRFDSGEVSFTGLPGMPSTNKETEDFGQSFVQMLDESEGGGENMDLVLDEDQSMEESIAAGGEAAQDAAQAALKKLKTLYKVSEDIGTELELDTVLEKIMDSIFEVFPQIDRGFIMLEDPDTGEMLPKVIRQRGAKEGEQIKLSVSRTIIQTAFREKKSILSSDAMDDDRFAEGLSIVNFGIRSMMCSPLFVGEEKLGVIHVDTQDQGRRFTQDDLSLLQGIGRQAAISIKNAKLVDDIEDETQKRNSLQRFLSPDLADQVMTGALDLKLGGDEKFGTVFFSDIIGFTRMSSILAPEVVVAKINRYFNRMIEIIFRYSGTINKFWGDAIMALWGLMSDSGDHSPQVQAVQACIDMQNALFDFNYSLIEEGQKPIWMGIGLNTGTFLAGNVGSEQQMEYTVIGDNVNLASRIESQAARGMIYISESTFERVKGQIYAIRMEPILVKGKEEPITMYSVRGFLDRQFNQQQFDRLTIPVSYADENGTNHNGNLTGYAFQEDKVYIFAHFRHQFGQGQKATLELNVPEIAEPGVLDCTLQQFTVVNMEDDAEFYNCTFVVDQGSAFFNDLMKNIVVDASVAPGNITRE